MMDSPGSPIFRVNPDRPGSAGPPNNLFSTSSSSMSSPGSPSTGVYPPRPGTNTPNNLFSSGRRKKRSEFKLPNMTPTEQRTPDQ